MTATKPRFCADCRQHNPLRVSQQASTPLRGSLVPRLHLQFERAAIFSLSHFSALLGDSKFLLIAKA